jgi:hypothetical protein
VRDNNCPQDLQYSLTTANPISNLPPPQRARFRSGGNGNSNARVLNAILKKNTVIEEVDLSYTGLDDDGIEEVR